MFRKVMVIVVLSVPCGVAACSDEDSVYTLYRDGYNYSEGEQDYKLRNHIATFDATVMSTAEGNNAYNLAICSFAQEYFQEKQPWVHDGKDKFWCEKGRYRK